jgi:hypothetical protein
MLHALETCLHAFEQHRETIFERARPDERFTNVNPLFGVVVPLVTAGSTRGSGRLTIQ